MNPDPLATTARIERAARSLTALAPLLTAGHIRPATSGTIGRVQAATSRPLPGGTEQQSLAREITETLAEWVQLLIDERDLRPQATRHDTRGLAGIIAAHAAWLGAHDAGDECAAELEAHVRAARGVIDRVPDKEYVGPCPQTTETGTCGLDLRKRPDARYAKCPAGHEVDGAATKARNLAALAEQWWPVAQIPRIVEDLLDQQVTAKAVEGWIRRGAETMTLTLSGRDTLCIHGKDVEQRLRKKMPEAA